MAAQAENPQQHTVENSKDLLQRLMISRNHIDSDRVAPKIEKESDEIELSLGLSLNGRFGVDPRSKKLTRSSSIPDFISSNPTNCGFTVPLSNGVSSSNSTNLARTCSLPTETDEEWRKRKEIQMLRRMEAKRKRSEKQRNFKALKDRKDCNFEEDKRGNGSLSSTNINGNYHNLNQEKFAKYFNGYFGVGGEGGLPPSSQGSVGSQRSGSSGLSESDSLPPIQGMNRGSESRSPVSVQSLSECDQKSTFNGKSGSPPPAVATKTGKPEGVNGAKETARNVLEDMPCVSTTGDGPDGKRVEGFLYRYRKGEEVRIVCVCHGSFLSPAEFVKHAGGGDVAHPLKHIVVNPYPLL
ncbi:ninja-family protein AFP3-like [Mercurialis annua]|uniref:ninja-family protein AFP3-like n=1 Tax=Mercurialis annua TaxID=3986 RepID=UPI00216020B4|nr:ninja-family protein AFP3-like [Mercurialis annua]